ncbi:hypothetical protein C0989_004454 [Termitomyces sp. Mn162]|nr:hypothetical protein C0989_004454 [Termitomyces sp. Mn162]
MIPDAHPTGASDNVDRFSDSRSPFDLPSSHHTLNTEHCVPTNVQTNLDNSYYYLPNITDRSNNRPQIGLIPVQYNDDDPQAGLATMPQTQSHSSCSGPQHEGKPSNEHNEQPSATLSRTPEAAPTIPDAHATGASDNVDRFSDSGPPSDLLNPHHTPNTEQGVRTNAQTKLDNSYYYLPNITGRSNNGSVSGLIPHYNDEQRACAAVPHPLLTSSGNADRSNDISPSNLTPKNFSGRFRKGRKSKLTDDPQAGLVTIPQTRSHSVCSGPQHERKPSGPPFDPLRPHHKPNTEQPVRTDAQLTLDYSYYSPSDIISVPASGLVPVHHNDEQRICAAEQTIPHPYLTSGGNVDRSNDISSSNPVLSSAPMPKKSFRKIRKGRKPQSTDDSQTQSHRFKVNVLVRDWVSRLLTRIRGSRSGPRHEREPSDERDEQLSATLSRTLRATPTIPDAYPTGVTNVDPSNSRPSAGPVLTHHNDEQRVRAAAQTIPHSTSSGNVDRSNDGSSSGLRAQNGSVLLTQTGSNVRPLSGSKAVAWKSFNHNRWKDARVLRIRPTMSAKDCLDVLRECNNLQAISVTLNYDLSLPIKRTILVTRLESLCISITGRLSQNFLDAIICPKLHTLTMERDAMTIHWAEASRVTPVGFENLVKRSRCPLQSLSLVNIFPSELELKEFLKLDLSNLRELCVIDVPHVNARCKPKSITEDVLQILSDRTKSTPKSFIACPRLSVLEISPCWVDDSKLSNLVDLRSETEGSSFTLAYLWGPETKDPGLSNEHDMIRFEELKRDRAGRVFVEKIKGTVLVQYD